MLIYLDNNATTQPDPQVIDAMQQVQREYWGNPSSVHRFGQQARQHLELARQQVAQLLNAQDRQIIFTSGGTESNNLALRGILDREPASPASAGATLRPLLITTEIEHSAVRQPAEQLARRLDVLRLPVSRDGLVQPRDLQAILAEHGPTHDPILVSVQWANNETGTIQPISELAACVRDFREQLRQLGHRHLLVFHTDATQAVGKIPVDVQATGVDMLTLAAHKFHGPKGVGALYVNTGIKLRAQNLGGPQERDRRGGTENTPAIVGMGVAAQLAGNFLADTSRITELTALRDGFESAMVQAMPMVTVNCVRAPRLWNTSNLAFARLEAEAILLGLSERQLCASAGAACSSGSLEPSPVLLAMGIAEPLAHGSVRFSLSRHTTAAEIEQAIPIVLEVVRKLALTMTA